MKISYNWLSEYVDHGLPPGELADSLTMSGLEVEHIEQSDLSLDGIIVGHVVSVRSHPEADRLRLCNVDLGDGETKQIVCGAPNVAANQRVPVATVGTKLTINE
ncbi:MAG: phenylalanine--tRNA ligase subunit beta, partial [Bacteroidetes bacterium]|nr:phenylalanine--tRNA ligase subunit beta [Bacteroidota bacterium]